MTFALLNFGRKCLVGFSLEPAKKINDITQDPEVRQSLREINQNQSELNPNHFDKDHDGFIDKTDTTRQWSKFHLNQVQGSLWQAGVLQGHPATDTPPEELTNFQKSKADVKFTPEYEYRRFFFIHKPMSENPKLLPEQVQLASKLVSSSPDTKITFMITKPEQANEVLSTIRKIDPQLLSSKNEGRINFVLDSQRSEYWAQDLGEATGGDKSKFVMGWSPGYGKSENYRDRPDVRDPSTPVMKIPAVLQGGNITKTRVNGKNLVVIGSIDVKDTQRQYKLKHGYEISKDEVTDIYRKAFGADEVMVLDSKQPRYAFHIDQAVFFPKPGVAVIIKPEDHQESSEGMQKVRDMIGEYKTQLRQNGFQVVEIPTTEKHIQSYHGYSNVIPLRTDAGTKLIMPSYGDSKLEKRIKKTLKENGMEVQFVPNTTFTKEGNTHCITGNFG